MAARQLGRLAGMTNIVIILVLLFGAFLIAKRAGANSSLAGRSGIAAVFAFTALGHFLKSDEMLQMIPPSFPAGRAAVLLSGLLEALLAIGVIAPRSARAAGIAICVFLVAVAPFNIYAAIHEVNFGGHGAGPKYLAIRLPLQLLLIAWTWWFAVHRRATPARGAPSAKS